VFEEVQRSKEAGRGVSITHSAIIAIQDYLSKRWRVRISIGDIVKVAWQNVISCFLRKERKVKKEASHEERKVHLYKKGEEKILRELDCVNIMTKLRQLDLLTSLFLNPKQRFLLNFQKKNLIKAHYSNESSQSSEEEGFE